MDAKEIERLQRVHVIGVRGVNNRFVVVVSDPEINTAGGSITGQDTWEVSWEQWVAAKADASALV